MPDASLAPVEVRTATGGYRAIAGPGALAELPRWLHAAGTSGNVRIVADESVWSAHAATIEAAFGSSDASYQVTTIGSGEGQKSLASSERLYEWLIQTGTQRGDVVVAIGGGVVGDLAGFVAATYLRGLPLVQVPTTLLAMVDSSIGGKVAVNHALGKNLIGAFHQPSLVVADTRILRSLPAREYRSGWAEVVKIAMIADGAFFAELRAQSRLLLAFEDEALLGRIVRRAIELKGAVVSKDEREDGRRIILNYGHTIGHALEAATNYDRYLHGEAVAIGMRGAATIAHGRGLLSAQGLDAQTEVLAAFGLPDRAESVKAATLYGPLSRDKKARGSAIRWVFATDVGSVTIADDVAPSEVVQALRAVGCD